MEMRKLRDKATEAFAKGRFSKAAEIYEEYCKAEPKDYQARLRMGDAWAKAGQKDRAVSAYQLAATGFAREGFLPRAIAASKLILELDPAHKGVQRMLADLYARKSAGDDGASQRPSKPARRVELPAFTENMGVSMGPSVAPLELPEEDMEIPLHAPLEIPESPPVARAAAVEEPPDEELAVVQGVPMAHPPEAPAAPAPAPVQAQPPPQAPEVSSPPLDPVPIPITELLVRPRPAPSPAPEVPPAPVTSEPAASEPVQAFPPAPDPTPAATQGPPPPRAPEPPAPSVSARPPGLSPRSTPQRPSVSVPAVPTEPPRAAPAPAPVEAAPVQANMVASADETSLEVDLGRGVKKLAWAALSEPLFPVATAAKESAPVAAAPVSSAPPPAASSPAAPTPVAPAPAAATPAGSAPPGLRPRRPSEPGMPDMAVTPSPGRSAVVASSQPPVSTAFTEPDPEGDTLLHAVEAAAISGVKQRAAHSADGTHVEDEDILSLTEEVSAEAPAAGALPNIPLFSDLPQDAFIELFERCPLRRFSQGQRVFEQGSHGNAFYVICEGSVHVFRHEGSQRKELATLGSGAFFGEMALLSGAPRMASVESTTEDTQLLEISAPVLAELSRQHPQVARALKKFCRERMLSNVMSTSALFEPFGRKDRRVLVEKFRAREVKRNEIIVREGDRTDGLYVVLSGEVEARKGDQVLSRMREGELFGEISLLSKTPATATVMAIRRTSLLRLPREDFDALILTHPQILVLVSELSEQRLRRTEALTGTQVLELTAEDLLV
ncbi:cyclic nucleotide-binding domain-containing protein [Hyalangium gracile]|uniref:cyclic nucleotide-binding domain-containing protein n=1 Tax=Hyalangium gracile TaxID=394092 RepID=UPI001CCDFF88|nr:cyclic nucleotide-binding domain-containing protein [Hyalangium gracile]